MILPNVTVSELRLPVLHSLYAPQAVEGCDGKGSEWGLQMPRQTSAQAALRGWQDVGRGWYSISVVASTWI